MINNQEVYKICDYQKNLIMGFDFKFHPAHAFNKHKVYTSKDQALKKLSELGEGFKIVVFELNQTDCLYSSEAEKVSAERKRKIEKILENLD